MTKYRYKKKSIQPKLKTDYLSKTMVGGTKNRGHNIFPMDFGLPCFPYLHIGAIPFKDESVYL